MRVALISDGEDDAGGNPRERLTLAGRTVARRQIDLALDLGCDRIACLTHSPSPQIVRMQSAAEKGGARFHAIAGARHLAGVVKAADEVLVIAPDLIADAAFVNEALGGRAGILALPAERGVAAGYERIDGDAAWAGVMLLPGAAIDRLADLPADSDPFSSLLRIAMQGGARRILVAPSVLDHGELALIQDAEGCARAEKTWLDRQFGASGWRRPVSAAVRFASRLLAPRLLIRERVVPAMLGIGSLLVAGGTLAAWYERAAAGFALVALASAIFLSSHALGRAADPRGRGPKVRCYTDAAVDAAFVAIAVLASPRDPQFALFSAFVAAIALRLARLHGPAAPIAPSGDRILVLLLAALATAFGKLLPALQLYAAATLGFELFLRSRSRLTRA